jgi:hypothetical protein
MLWRGLEFKSAVVWYVVLFYVGAAIGHILLTVVKAVLLTWLLVRARREMNSATARG